MSKKRALKSRAYGELRFTDDGTRRWVGRVGQVHVASVYRSVAIKGRWCVFIYRKDDKASGALRNAGGNIKRFVSCENAMRAAAKQPEATK